MDDRDLEKLRESELLPLVGSALEIWFPGATVTTGSPLNPGSRPDFLVQTPLGQSVIVEVKGYRFTTDRRIDDAEQQLRRYLDEARAHSEPAAVVRSALVLAGPLSSESRIKLMRAGVSYAFDGPQLREALNPPDVDMGSPATPLDVGQLTKRAAAASLHDRLDLIVPGRASWSQYQRLICEILELSWCPPLEKALYESSDATGVNRRDMIFPNYATSGFWEYLRRRYCADHIVVDAKNWSSPVDKNCILQIANYLSVHGAGMLGVLVTRQGVEAGAEQTRREQWITDQKMVVVLNDHDIFQMLTFYADDGDASNQVRQKIEDFRLSF